VAASFLAEFLKLRKRPAAWVLMLVWATVVILFGYLFTYSFVSAPAPEDAPREQRAQQEAFSEELLSTLMPENLLENLFVNGTFAIGGAIVLILGALASGSEYGWGTLKTVLTQRPGRLGAFSGKLLALGAILVLFVLVGLAAGSLGSLVVARLEDAAVDWPPLRELAKGLGVGVLIFAVWGSLGFALAVLFRGTPLAIGLGLAYALAVENAIAALPIESEAFENVRRIMLGENTSSVSGYFGSPSQAFGAPEPLVEPGRAALVLTAYTVGFILLAAFFFRRRDVT
jgi:ABC-type transport system involved in multi-copper enzyme maturation permease subunit